LVAGEYIASIITKTVALIEATLGTLMDVTNVSGNVTPSLLPSGETFVGVLGDLFRGLVNLMANIMNYLS
jgi:hypothetical protein